MPSCGSPIFAKRAGTVRSVKSAGSQLSSSRQLTGAETRGVGPGPHRIGRRNRAVLRVLVVVDEDAVPLFLPPFAGGQLRRAPLDLARQRQRGAAHLVEAPRLRCARSRGCRASPRSWASRSGRSPPARLPPRARLRGSAASRRRAPDRGRPAARRDGPGRRRAPDADAARCRRGWPSRPAPRRRAAPPPRRCGRRESGSAPPPASPAGSSGARFWKKNSPAMPLG